MAPNLTRVDNYTSKAKPSPASPSASIILVSPSNEVLLLHRKQTSSAFPSAHVFPGGNLDASDGELPASPTDVDRHRESLPYRIGAIRELFEETGILLAKDGGDSGSSLLQVSDSARLAGRRAVHTGRVTLQQWLRDQSPRAILHTEALLPFTHWITPPNVPRRFTTQMYVYFVPLGERDNPSIRATGDEVETVQPEFRTARAWLRLAQAGHVILFPPQFLLLHLASRFLDGDGDDDSVVVDDDEILARRRRLHDFITTDRSPVPWTHKYISPIGSANPWRRADGDGDGDAEDDRIVLRLHRPGPELQGSGLVGDTSRVILTKFQPEGTRQLEVRLAADLVADGKRRNDAAGKL